MTEKVSFTCSCCGQTYEQIPLCFGGGYPDYYFSVPPAEREHRIELAESLCVIDDHYFHRGRISIPIVDYQEELSFDVWTSISEENFERRCDLWEDEQRVNQAPYFGWLQTLVPTYGNTLNIKTMAHENKIGYIPDIEIIEESHPLYTDQQQGITLNQAMAKVQQILKELHQQ